MAIRQMKLNHFLRNSSDLKKFDKIFLCSIQNSNLCYDVKADANSLHWNKCKSHCISKCIWTEPKDKKKTIFFVFTIKTSAWLRHLSQNRWKKKATYLFSFYDLKFRCGLFSVILNAYTTFSNENKHMCHLSDSKK